MMEIPDESLAALKISEEQAGEALRMAAAVKLFEMGRLSQVLRLTSPAFLESSSSPDSRTTGRTPSA